jgi:hypothetical protein
MATNRDRREAAEILRRIIKQLPDPTPVQVAFLLGQASALELSAGHLRGGRPRVDDGATDAREARGRHGTSPK